MNEQELLIKRIIDARRTLRDLSFEHWLNYEVFTWVWWLSLIVTVVFFLIWWKVVDRDRIMQISIHGLIVTILASFLDIAGVELVLWNYPIRVVPYHSLLFHANFIFFPVLFMLIYQYFPQWKRFIFVNTATSAILAFILEPLCARVNQYQPIRWNATYSFILYTVSVILSRLIIEKINSIGDSQ